MRYEPKSHAEFCARLHDLKILKESHRVCLFAQRCIAQPDETETEMNA